MTRRYTVTIHCEAGSLSVEVEAPDAGEAIDRAIAEAPNVLGRATQWHIAVIEPPEEPTP